MTKEQLQEELAEMRIKNIVLEKTARESIKKLEIFDGELRKDFTKALLFDGLPPALVEQVGVKSFSWAEIFFKVGKLVGNSNYDKAVTELEDNKKFIAKLKEDGIID